ncbi:hypothetical protein BJX61DRAFT_545212 [Aspergillus egyptiacus]|nr:hypothetical protein BJX61DRAFT_545212 [Aspergillus egyptiacus]
MNPISIDGNCGANSDTNATCTDSPFGNCCSAKGYCGSTLAYCGEGCQLPFGKCNDASVQTISTTGSCGATLTSNITCLDSTYGDCCSRNGYCGGNSSYCGTGCQAEFGRCDSDSHVPSGTPSELPSSQTESDGGLSAGAIAGISVGAAVGGLAVVALAVWLVFFRRRRAVPGPEVMNGNDIPPMILQRGGLQEMDGKGGAAVAELPTPR